MLASIKTQILSTAKSWINNPLNLKKIVEKEREKEICQSFGMKELISEIETLRSNSTINSLAKSAIALKKMKAPHIEIVIVLLDKNGSVINIPDLEYGICVTCKSIDAEISSLFGESDTLLIK